MKCFGTPPPKKIAAVPGPGVMKRFMMASDLVVLEEIHDRAALSRHPVRLGQRAIRRRRDEERHAVAEAGGGDRAAEPLGVQPSTELVHEPDARDGRPGPR